ncbi:C-type lectin 1-like [Watersipora subatra]|uniref:C-type lectin 1-like n=1 Tax=Watersipora subatra TaxID=2589382 RepID=UPI00355BB3B0
MGYRAFHKPLRESTYWIGGFKENGVWKWKGKYNDSTMTIQHWAPGEPNNYKGPENCLELRGSDLHYTWNDSPLGANALTCPNEWVTSVVGTCYKFFSNKASWNQAQSLCEDEGGILANLQDMHEIYWLMGYRAFHKPLQTADYWIGGFKKDGVWKWKGKYNDSTMTIQHWAPGEPNNRDGHENCLELCPSDLHYTWNDSPCEILLSFICEKNQS